MVHLRCGPDLADALVSEGLSRGEPGDALVFAAADVGDDWDDVLAELTAAFQLTREAVRNKAPVVYVVAHDDLLGRRGPGPAMVATGLLSGARTAAVEQLKAGAAVNVLAVEADSDPDSVATWVARLLEPNGPTGEIVRMGGAHLGKALP